jgi:hypothetical protein
MTWKQPLPRGLEQECEAEEESIPILTQPEQELN